MKKIIRGLVTLICMLAVLTAGFALAEAVGTQTTPEPTPAPTPSPQDLRNLEIVITDGEGNTVRTATYGDFIDGRYTLEGLPVGTYTIQEVNAAGLLTELGYTFDAENSVSALTFEVTAENTAIGATLRNVYERVTEPEVTETPETSEPPKIDENEKIRIPVVKVWDDAGNWDGNRPSMVEVRLLADGVVTAKATLSAAGGWRYEFTDLPKYSNGREIAYSVEETSVPMYESHVDGFTITNVYVPETTSATVVKLWDDDNNAAGMRPGSVYCVLNNGMSVTLSEENGWTATIDHLPKTINGRPAEYRWTEQEVIGYTQIGRSDDGGVTVFTNAPVERARKELRDGKKAPAKARGDTYLIIEDYGTPLGVEVVINHVGDCFD